MKCNKAIERFLELDNYTALPFSIRLHTTFCPKCENEIFSLQEKFNSLHNAVPFKPEFDITNSVMSEIALLETSYEHNVSNLKWFSVGAIILGSIFLIPFSNNLSWLRVYFGANLEIPLSIVMGLAISVYAVLFIGSHLEELKKTSRNLEKVRFIGRFFRART
ncbi:MAG: hypothetical protein GY754_47090 [bacterium]|nr:hypothetical protein [bacterium]